MRILCRVAESFYIGDVQAKLQERAVDRRVRRSRSPSFLPVSSTMTGTIACGYVEGGVRVGLVDRGDPMGDIISASTAEIPQLE
jgi:hypothetical protein